MHGIARSRRRAGDAAINPPTPLSEIVEIVRRYWGYDTLLPLQAEAIDAGIQHRDALVVLPTGGGKSLCYQVPPALVGRTDVVVSPLIALMKDQVDGLRACGYPAVGLHSGMSAEAQRAAEAEIAAGRCRLVFVAPERLLTAGCLRLFERARVRAFAIDEAHCISQWGHEFRPEYRQLATLRDRFPDASIHAFTATATERVRADIVDQLRLVDPTVLIGRFDRPNLTYRIVPRVDLDAQLVAALARHAGEAAIVYCLSRNDTESIAAMLAANGVNAAPYHAGMDTDARSRTQEAFAEERLDVVVATVAFGMGIDRSNVRCVVHAAMPKSIEHYQQETGRAGRDGLEAECVLFYSAADAIRWRSIMTRGAAERDVSPEVQNGQFAALRQMQALCASPRCRHRALTEYFGQDYVDPACGACDVCLDEVDWLPEATVVAQKILSCVARTGERFGVAHVVAVLAGADTQAVRNWNHHLLSTHGLLRDLPRTTIVNLIYQLVDLGALVQTDGDRPTLKLNDTARSVMRGQQDIRLQRLPERAPTRTDRDDVGWEGVDRGLFEHLRALRADLARERSVPAYIIFGDATLRGLAGQRPSTLASFRHIRGVGERKLDDLGPTFLAALDEYCDAHDLARDVGPPAGASDGDVDRQVAGREIVRPTKVNSAKQAAFELFAAGRSIDDVAARIDRAPSTIHEYLADYIAIHTPDRLDPWVDDATYGRVAAAVAVCGTERLRPIFDELGGAVPYEVIRPVVRHLQVRER